MARFQNLKNWRFAALWRQASVSAVEPGFQPGGTGVRNDGDFKVLGVAQPSTVCPGGAMPPPVSGTDARRHDLQTRLF